MLLYSTRKYAKQFRRSEIIKVEAMPFGGSGAGINADNSGYITVPMSRNEGHKGKDFKLILSEEEAGRMIFCLQEGLARLDSIKAENKKNGYE